MAGYQRYGEGWFRKRGRRSYQMGVEGPRGLDGKRNHVRRTVRGTKRDAISALRQLVIEVQPGEYVRSTGMTFGEFYALFVERYVQGKGRAYRTVQNYRGSGKKYFLPKLGGTRLGDISLFMLDGLMAGWEAPGSLSPATIDGLYSKLSLVLKVAVTWKSETGLAKNPAADWVRPRSQRKAVEMVPLEVIPKLFEACKGTRYLLPVQLAFFAGLRLHEALGLRWRDINLDACTLTVSSGMVKNKKGVFDFGRVKTNSSFRTVRIAAGFAEILRTHREDVEALLNGAQEEVWGRQVCVCPDGELLMPLGVSRGLRGVVDSAGLGGLVTIRRLRHSYSSILLHQGVNILSVQDSMGHSTIKITGDTYGHIVPASDQVAGAGPSPLDEVLDKIFDMVVDEGWGDDSGETPE